MSLLTQALCEHGLRKGGTCLLQEHEAGLVTVSLESSQRLATCQMPHLPRASLLSGLIWPSHFGIYLLGFKMFHLNTWLYKWFFLMSVWYSPDILGLVIPLKREQWILRAAEKAKPCHCKCEVLSLIFKTHMQNKTKLPGGRYWSSSAEEIGESGAYQPVRLA